MPLLHERPLLPERPLRRRRPALLALHALLVVFSCLLPACSQPGPGEQRALEELRRLVFVPAGTWDLPGFEGLGATSDLLVDRFEVTRQLWREVAEESDEPELLEVVRRWGAEERGGGELPATHCSFEEAALFASARGMRLPRVEEWTYLAAGRESLPWPWGRRPRASAANSLELGLQTTLPVGTFQSGTTDTGLYDLLGNVWEWASGSLPRRVRYRPAFLVYPDRGAAPAPEGVAPEELIGEEQVPGDASSPFEQVEVVEYVQPIDAFVGYAPRGDEQQILGGSFAWRQQRLWSTSSRGPQLLARGVGRGYHAGDVGVRCVVEASGWLEANAGLLSRPGLRSELKRIGEGWGSRAAPLLEELAGLPDSERSLGWLLEGARP